MKAVQIVAPNQLEFVTVASRPLESWEVRIAVAAAVICGSDFKVIRSPISIPMIPGHEFSGVVVEVSAEAQNTFHFGDRVTAFPMISCLECVPCLAGKFRDCEEKLSLGYQLPGAFAEEIIVDSRFVIHVEDDLSFEQGALVEHLCCGYRLAQELACDLVSVDSHVVVIGDGPIAMADIQMLLLFNYQNIMVIGKHTKRLDLALKLGAAHVLHHKDIALMLKKQEHPIIDVCIFSAPADETLNEVLPFLSLQGMVFPQTRIQDGDALSYIENSSIRFGRAFAYEFSDFSTVMNLIKNHRVNTELLVSERVKLSELPRHISTLQKSRNAAKTVILNEGLDETIKSYRRRGL